MLGDFTIHFPTKTIKSKIFIIIFCSIFVVVGLIVNIVAGVLTYRKNNNLSDLRYIEGKIILRSVNSYFDDYSGEYRNTYTYEAEYEVDGQKQTVETIFEKDIFSVDDKVTIEVNINNKNTAKIINKNFTFYLLQYLPFIIGSVFMLAGGTGLFITLKKKNEEYSF